MRKLFEDAATLFSSIGKKGLADERQRIIEQQYLNASRLGLEDIGISSDCNPENKAMLLWVLTAASIKVGRPHIARRAIECAELRLGKDGWPEYYDGKSGRYIGKQARKHQTWSVAGYVVAKMLIEDPTRLSIIALGDDKQLKPAL
ncbi:probable alkaline/neutral invertase B, partial [Tanacetum coccineum]